jgi:hypothetical protein
MALARMDKLVKTLMSNPVVLADVVVSGSLFQSVLVLGKKENL